MDKRQNGETRGMKKRVGNFCLCSFLMAVCTLSVLVSGCGLRTASSANTKPVVKEYTKGQIMVVAATERNRYQNVYTNRLWSVTADQSGNTFEQLLQRQIEQFLEELAAVNLLAQEQKTELTSQEKDCVKSLSEEYYLGLTEGDKAYMGASQEEIYDLYCQYYLADKVAAQLTDSREMEVSDAEAKVIQVQRIELSDRDRADSVLAQVRQEKADFAAIAAKNSLDSQTTFSLEWDKNMDSLTQASFNLNQDEISEPIEWNGHFYIVKCISAYDADATAARKSRLQLERKAQIFKQIFEPFSRENAVKLKDGIWNEVDFSAGEDCTSDNFFQLYHETCS